MFFNLDYTNNTITNTPSIPCFSGGQISSAGFLRPRVGPLRRSWISSASPWTSEGNPPVLDPRWSYGEAIQGELSNTDDMIYNGKANCIVTDPVTDFIHA